MGPMIPKEMKYNLHYGEVRGDVLPPPHGPGLQGNFKVKLCHSKGDQITFDMLPLATLLFSTQKFFFVFCFFTCMHYKLNW